MYRRIAMTLALACGSTALAQGTTEIQVPQIPPAAAPPAAATPAPPMAPLTVTGETQPGPGPSLAPPPPPAGNPGEIVIDATTPGTSHGVTHEVRLPPKGPGREAFLREYIRVDPRANAPFQGTRFLSAKEFYGQIGRTDLLAESDGQTRKRIWLMAAATLVAVGGSVTGVVVLGNAQNLNDPRCFAGTRTNTYNECVDRAKQTTLIGGLIIAGSIAAGGGILTWALSTPEMVTPSDETVRLATEYNRKLSVRHGAPPDGATLQILPSIGPGGASLAARLTF